jgi:uncharacterized Zn-binding protein involved in type VI secretion
MKRHYLKVGDKSSENGTITDGNPGMTHQGVQLAFLGSSVSCPACNSVGKIVAKGPRWPGDLMGKQAAFDGDFCVCKCEPHPVMIASQSDMYQSFETHELGAMGYAPNGKTFEEEANAHDQHFRIINSDGEPVEGLSYMLKSSDGQTIQGVTSSAGITQLVSADSAHEVQFLLHTVEAD